MQALASLHVAANEATDNPWRLASLQRGLTGEGFHRELTFTVQLKGNNSGNGAAGGGNGAGHTAAAARQHTQASKGSKVSQLAPACQLAFVQPLPAGVYADMDQISNLAAAARKLGPATSFDAQLFGLADAERTEVECEPTALLLQLNATSAAPHTNACVGSRATAAGAQADTAGSMECSIGSGSGRLAGESVATAGRVSASLTVPVHARYPAPEAAEAQTDMVGCRAWLESPMRELVLPPALVATLCEGSDLTVGWQLLPQSGNGHHAVQDVTWQMPTGSQRHAAFVTFVTAGAYLATAAAVVLTTFKVKF